MSAVRAARARVEQGWGTWMHRHDVAALAAAIFAALLTAALLSARAAGLWVTR
ncbi:MAG: hypothetical protein QM714_02605 [Nocardioides sp.]|uniref:hypothetical protein n=1 Tax=Nocardioides sp. TaxID=35761 RepID=UPI0039E320C3